MLCFAALPSAHAEGGAQSCVAIADDAARLSCFDRLYAAPAARTAVAAAAEDAAAAATPASVPAPAETQTADAKKEIDLQQSYQATVESGSPQVVLSRPAAADADTVLARLFDLGENQKSGIFTVREHNPMYLLPVYYRSSPNYAPHSPVRGTSHDSVLADQKRMEAKMKVSFKTKLWEDLFASRADLWFGYTQESNWQVYNRGEESAPFRNNDYAPEFFLTQPVRAKLPFGGRLRMLGLGYVHQSNGKSRPQSRSWNRVYAFAGMEWGRLTVMPRVWARIDPNSSVEDDNPDIGRYMGYGDVKLLYQHDERHSFMSTVRYNPLRNKGFVEVGYTFPLRNKLKLYVKGFHGYGENLLDYNRRQSGIGIGVLLNDWNSL